MSVTLGPRTSGAGHEPSACPDPGGRGDYRPTHACPHHVDATAGVLPGPLRFDGCEQEAAAREALHRQPPSRRQEEAVARPLRASSPAAGTCSPAAPAGWPARSPARRRPSRSPPSTAGTASAWPCWAWRSCSARPPWSNGIGPVGAGLAQGVRWIIGSLVMVLPVVLFFAALRLLRRPPSPEARGRLVIGWLSHDRLGPRHRPGRRAPAPTREGGVPGSGGLLGWAVGTPLSAGVGADRHRRPARAARRSSACWSPPPRRSTRSPSGCRSSPTGCSAATTTTTTSTTTRRTTSEEPRQGRAASRRKSLSEDLLKTGPIDLGALGRRRRRDDHHRAGAHPAARRPPSVEDRTAPPEDLPPIDEPQQLHHPAGRGQLRAARR